MKLTTMTQVSVDGVMQGNGGATEEDRRSGFERGGWAGPPVFGDDTAAFITQTYQRAGAFLFGRLTYEAFAGTWGAIADMRAHPIGVALAEAPKYVASSTLTEPNWANTTVLSGDLAAAIGELKARPGGELQVHGSGALIRWLLEKNLVERDDPGHRPGGRRPGHAAVPRFRPGHGAGPGRIASRLERYNDPGLPAGRAPAVCDRLKHMT